MGAWLERISAGFRFGGRNRAVSSDQYTVLSFAGLPTLVPGSGQNDNTGLAWRKLLILWVLLGTLTGASGSETSFPGRERRPLYRLQGTGFRLGGGQLQQNAGLSSMNRWGKKGSSGKFVPGWEAD